MRDEEECERERKEGEGYRYDFLFEIEQGIQRFPPRLQKVVEKVIFFLMARPLPTLPLNGMTISDGTFLRLQ